MTNTGKTVAWTRRVGEVLIDWVNIEIGGQEIDRHYGDWLTIWNELTQTAEHEDGYNVLIGNTTALTTPAETIPSATLYIPLQFWFCRNPGLALPLIALQYHEVKFNIQFADASDCYITSDNNTPASGTPSMGDASLWIDYVYLDTDERRQFAQVQHELRPRVYFGLIVLKSIFEKNMLVNYIYIIYNVINLIYVDNVVKNIYNLRHF